MTFWTRAQKWSLRHRIHMAHSVPKAQRVRKKQWSLRHRIHMAHSVPKAQLLKFTSNELDFTQFVTNKYIEHK